MIEHDTENVEELKEIIRKLQDDSNKLETKLISERDKNTRLSNELAEMDRENRSLQHEADHDVLTGLYHNGKFRLKVSNILRGRRHNEIPGSCLAFIDVDKFKSINDHYGHSIGDDVLKEIAEIIINEIREDDLASRIGDEFLIFFNHANKDDASVVVARIALLVKNIRFGEENNATSISYGVAMRSAKLSTFDELYSESDKLMYEQKRSKS